MRRDATEMHATSVPALFCIAAVSSAVGGALGMASGIFIVPLLTIVAGVNVHLAIGASIVSVIACSCGSAPAFLSAGLANVRLAIVLETATTLGAASGALMSGAAPPWILYGTFSAVLLVSAWQMTARRADAAIPPDGARGREWARRLDAVYSDGGRGEVAYRVERLPAGLGLMCAAGLLSALLGIGSGVLKIPAMDAALRLPLKVSSATSNFMIGVTAAASAGAYFMRGEIAPQIAGPVALGSVVGASLGARALALVAPGALRLVFVAVLLLLALQMALAAFGARGGL